METINQQNENSNPSLGYYPNPGWEWQKPEPKTYLKEHNLAQYARVWILNLVEIVHWILLVPSFILSFIIFQHGDALAERLGTDIQVYLLSVAPLIQAFAGLVAVVMHEYEGWQVAYFKNPLDTDFDIKNFNNEWLREVAYKMLFFLQIVGLLAFSLGVFGINKVSIAFAVASIVLAFLAPQNPKATFTFNNQPVFPIATALVVIFIVNAIVNFIAYYYLFSPALQLAQLPRILAGLAPLLFMMGGVIEGVFAESTFNQWIHFGAVIFLNLGLLVQIYFFNLLW
ncbi:hypothetical protein XM38_015390 [Halomicronema hongdechloris C2206]|uniref:Uncharacterized protein n=1 Tax=Halomicronema hongdechloris C2206 TaxID=1641165 RepID=A0A1Z3HJW1_9CYAN|nr:hypothetical protein [Halomicronema hongdechloris]ASC70599.1 hypothetical protein XM38_015390 [Halomicronema hongdechloris C2206]